jgi:hypothetical protein
MTKIAGSGSISQRHGSADPYTDPPQHCTSLIDASGDKYAVLRIIGHFPKNDPITL